jgi:hypothetical protein
MSARPMVRPLEARPTRAEQRRSRTRRERRFLIQLQIG